MFTGIIHHCGIIVDITTIPNGLRFKIQHEFPQLELGESIAMDGVCITVTDFDKHTFSCDISPETLKVTTLKNLKKANPVNLERALLLNSRLGGHFVMGHVDQIAPVKQIQPFHDFTQITFTGLNKENKKFIFKKGSIAINGVSLTINDITENEFSVMLIPHTLTQTNLKNLVEQDIVNIEFDMLTRMVARQLEKIRHE